MRGIVWIRGKQNSETKQIDPPGGGGNQVVASDLAVLVLFALVDKVGPEDLCVSGNTQAHDQPPP
jgi:hypothetical protein